MNNERSVMRVFLAPGSRGSQRFWRILFLRRNKVGWDLGTPGDFGTLGPLGILGPFGTFGIPGDLGPFGTKSPGRFGAAGTLKLKLKFNKSGRKPHKVTLI